MELIVKSCKISELADSQLITNVYLYPDFLSLLNEYFKLEAKYLTVRNLTNNQLLAITGSFEKKILGIPSIINPRIVYYQPIETFLPQRKYPNENQLQKLEIYQKISEYYHKYYFKISKNLSPLTSDIRGFLWSGLSSKTLYTYTFDLENYSIDNYFKRQRASLRKAERLPYTFSQHTDIPSYLKLLQGTKQRQDWNFDIDEKVLHDFLTKLTDLMYVKQFNILDSQQRIVSTMFCILDYKNKIAYAWLASTDLKELSNGLSTLIIHQICLYLKSDFKIFDLCGANTDSIARFKASLGADLKVFYRIEL